MPKGFEDPASLVIPKGKIVKYCLNKEHVKGGSKAVAFEKYLGYTQEKLMSLKHLFVIVLNKVK